MYGWIWARWKPGGIVQDWFVVRRYRYGVKVNDGKKRRG